MQTITSIATGFTINQTRQTFSVYFSSQTSLEVLIELRIFSHDENRNI